MALRRPASSRAKVAPTNSSTNPQPRSRSVMSRPPLASRSGEELRHESAMAGSISRQQKNLDDAETNIQVVLRCRRRNEREITDNSPIIVTSNGAKSKELSIESSVPTSSLGIVTLPPTRTYPFDLVFGPEADQAMIYHEVVHPMLEEVLMGYNCTLFAYGQTGTGKTYTMQGDLNPSPMGNPSSNAGMIPRVLFRLFHQLDACQADYSVKVSFLELYNEELRDLLSEDLSPPNGSMQPMGIALKDNLKQSDNGLKIFDDVNKRGVFIQGLEEIAVKDLKDALTLLTKGSVRRQIAATKFNDHSSRSHSVFSITVHIKETSAMGDDLLKIGKLNLVDLAGSENIGRSGAESKRAREAGMINQSLLTLGRVINALVDKAQHVPYRESKLTRILQDSLGGHTKTCIIATISPARCNMEETLSTLDYAMRAKSIRNKPELNQRMTRNSLLKDYIVEIERLKADLLAAREKNGIFFSEETMNQMNAEQELKQTELEEAKKQVEIVESQIRNVREEFEQSITLLMKTDEELKDTKATLADTEEHLSVAEGDLRMMKAAFEDEVIVRRSHQETEAKLDAVARGLKNVAQESVRDLEGLFQKLARNSKVLESNTAAVSSNKDVISASTKALTQHLEEFYQFSAQSLSILQSEAKKMDTTEVTVLHEQAERIDQHLQRMQEAMELIRTQDSSESISLDAVQKVLGETHLLFAEESEIWRKDLQQTCARLFKTLDMTAKEVVAILETGLNDLNKVAHIIVQESQNYLEREQTVMLEANTLVNKAAAEEISHLRHQNDALTQVLARERICSARAKDDLLQRISGLLNEFTKERDLQLREAVELMQSRNAESEGAMSSFSSNHTSMWKDIESSSNAMESTLQRNRQHLKRARDYTFEILDPARTSFQKDLRSLEDTVSESVGSYSAWVLHQSQELSNSHTDAFNEHSRSKRARIGTIASLEADLQSNYHDIQTGIASTSKHLSVYATQILSSTSTLDASTEAYHRAASRELDTMNSATDTLANHGMTKDVPTCKTPKKKVWKYTDQWDLTRSREELLYSWKEKQGLRPSSPISRYSPTEPIIKTEDNELTTLNQPSLESSNYTVSKPADPLASNKPTLIMGTLVESRKKNVMTSRGSRRVR